MYDQDSFFTLSLAGRAGLVAVSLALASIWFGVVAKVSCGRGAGARAGVALAAFWLFEWVSPQLFYLYYIVLLDVPVQVVIGAPPGPAQVVGLLSFSGPATLSAHARGALGLGLLAVALLNCRRSGRSETGPFQTSRGDRTAASSSSASGSDSRD